MDFKQYQVSGTLEKEISHRFIAHLIGLLLAFESILLLLCYFVSIMFGESDLKLDYSSKNLTPTHCLRRSSLRSVIGKPVFYYSRSIGTFSKREGSKIVLLMRRE